MSSRIQMEGYPRGWFVVAFSDELAAGGVKKLRYFGQNLVAYREDGGEVHILDGHCPHMGAHLGGGVVVGSELQCPFHKWRFNAEGRCVAIPYCEKIPPKAQIRSWTVRELNGMIYIWYHPEDAPPDFELPILPCHDSDDWLPWQHSVLRIQTHSKEIVENVVDRAHFAPVHGTHVERFENDFDGHLAIQRTKGTAYPRGGGKDLFELDATYYGPGFQISDMRGYVHSLLVNAHTMVDENCLDLRFGVSLQPREDAAQDAKFSKMYIDNLTRGFLEDVEIWEGKIYLERPVLCAGDGPIMKLRRWYAQFFSSSALP